MKIFGDVQIIFDSILRFENKANNQKLKCLISVFTVLVKIYRVDFWKSYCCCQLKNKSNILLLPHPLTVGESPMSNENPVTWRANHKSILAVRLEPPLWSNLMRIFPVNIKAKTTIKILLQHYHNDFTSSSIRYPVYQCGLIHQHLWSQIP